MSDEPVNKRGPVDHAPETAKKREWPGWILCTLGAMLVAYILLFVVLFDVTGCPARTREHWLGPLPWDCTEAVDAGKIYVLDEPVPDVYTAFRPLCSVWLFLNGLEDKPPVRPQ